MLFACGNPTAETNDDAQMSETTTNLSDRIEDRQAKTGLNPDSLVTNQLMDMFIENLTEDLSLTTEQQGQIREIYLAEHMKTEDTNSTVINKEGAKKLRSHITRNTIDAVNAVLTPEQRKSYEKFIR